MAKDLISFRVFSMDDKNLEEGWLYVRVLRIALLLTLATLLAEAAGSSPGEVIWAVNCGGEAHVDLYGIAYMRDPLQRVGVSSDFGRSLLIQRVPPVDQILYQTERYHTDSFTYEVPISREGDYVLVLKFCEVWFTQPNQKVFDIVLNGQITVIDGLDIFAKVGRGVAYDEIIPFSIRNGRLQYGAEVAPFAGKLVVEFVKLEKDNPKVNAMYVMRGSIEDVPRLAMLHDADVTEPTSVNDRGGTEDDDDDLDDDDTKSRKSRRHASTLEQKVADPYASDDTGSMLLPVVVAVGAFIPLLFCLCRL